MPSLLTSQVGSDDRGVKKVYYGAANEKFGGIEFEPNVSKMLPRPYTAIGWRRLIVGGLLKEEAVEVLKLFYQKGNENLPEEKRHRHKKLKTQDNPDGIPVLASNDEP